MNLSSRWAVDIWLFNADLGLAWPDLTVADFTLLSGLTPDFCEPLLTAALIASSYKELSTNELTCCCRLAAVRDPGAYALTPESVELPDLASWLRF